jgi:hypothetical protein
VTTGPWAPLDVEAAHLTGQLLLVPRHAGQQRRRRGGTRGSGAGHEDALRVARPGDPDAEEEASGVRRGAADGPDPEATPSSFPHANTRAWPALLHLH